MSVGLKTITSAVISSMVMMAGAHAAGFGKLTILSSLGQPLRAEIELTSVAKDEESQLVAKLASADAYKQANIDFNPALLSLQFSIDQRGVRKFVRVTSTQPINEPFVAVLMELGGTNTRVVREYNVLLDPASSHVAQSAQITVPVRPSAVGPTIASAPSGADAAAFLPGARNDRSFPRYSEKKIAQPDHTESRTAKTSAPAATGDKKRAGDYRVKKGDTLYQIADTNLPDGVSIDQMLVALYRGNQNAFINKNINRLRSGQILSIPDADNARTVSSAEARSVILAMSKDFNGYRNTLAGQLLTATPRAGDEAKQSGGGKITAKVEEPANPTNDAKDKLKLSRAGGTSKADAKLVAATEEQVAHEKTNVEANTRVKELEKNINDLQKVIDQKNKNLEELQKQADSSGKASAAPSVGASPQAALVVGSTPSSMMPTVAGVAPNAPSITPVLSVAAVADASPPKPTQPKQIPKLATPSPESSTLSGLADNPLLLPGVGVLALLLAALGISRLRRNKQQVFLANGGRSQGTSGIKSSTLFGAAGGQSTDTKNSVFNSNFVPSVSDLDTNVDPVAEADVYIAYGRDLQAEEILKEALRGQPTRDAIRVKLLEIYAARKDVRAFEILASELYSLTVGKGEDWQQAAALGVTIDPTNPLYGRGDLPEQVVSKAASITAPTQPMEGLEFNAPRVIPGPLNTQSRILDVEEVAVPILLTPSHVDADPLKDILEPDDKPDLDFDFAPLDDPVDKSHHSAITMTTPESAKAILESLDFDLENKALTGSDFSVTGSSAETGVQYKHIPSDPTVEVSGGVPTLLEPVIPLSNVASTFVMAAPLEFEFSAMDLDLVNVADKHSLSEEILKAPLVMNNTEMATKLDLAAAYQEIGDSEGARELLEEVLKGGDVGQIATAKALLVKLT
ncbi:FimV/HubP family polar landmark protein [Glaciimonas sp. Gout2]|uniref:FimV/HubP family polar landmark protein n=2 Tax=Glaciimonas TaxID=1229970 RepID=UPI002B225005|nr:MULTISPECIES: FimV/HubP family polar landmark protein [unclassified Glaciimonas]MEB0010350.1 FimV/HubP family polar landmark protein [Glaciimonas sp. Cout2]MEB0084461.1 FimV/HubP family polar landmark protein [Glaciimonas sp. Gout2]